MAQHHLQRLSATDASILANETPSAHMHLGALIVLDPEGPGPDYDALLDLLGSRLHLVPRYRQKLAHPPLETGRPLWIDDPSFQIADHVHRCTLHAPGGEAELFTRVAEIMSVPLDRRGPLWEMWLIDGLSGGRVALVTKNHHALVDGVGGVDLATVIFDLGPEPPDLGRIPAWDPQPEPGQAELAVNGVLEIARTGLGLTGSALGALRNPARAANRALDAAEGLAEVARAMVDPAPATPLNVPIGPDRRLAGVRVALSEFKTIKNALGGTVNDVVLAVVAGALRRWLQGRDVDVSTLELRALVPVSIRAAGEHAQLGNRIVAMRGPLPVHVADPAERLRLVSTAMTGLKDSRQALGAEVLTTLEAFAPPTILAQAARINFSTRLFNLLVTNVPGPQLPLYVRGRRMQEVFPIAFLPEDHALAVAIMSYDGQMNFGLLADYDAVPDLDVIAQGIEDALGELLAIASIG